MQKLRPKLSCHKCKRALKVYYPGGRINYNLVFCLYWGLEVPRFFARFCIHFEPTESYKRHLERIKKHNEFVERLRSISYRREKPKKIKISLKDFIKEDEKTEKPKRGRGRPRKIVPVGLVIELRNKGYTMKEIVEIIKKKGYNVSRKTIYNRLNELGLLCKKSV